MDVVGPFALELQVVIVGLRGSLGTHVFGDEEAGETEVDLAEAFSSAALEDPVVGVEAGWGSGYVSRAMCSKRTFLRRCLSRWRRRSSGVCVGREVRVPAA